MLTKVVQFPEIHGSNYKPQLNNEILQELTPCFKTSYCHLAVLIKILFKSDRFFKFQNVVKLSNSFHYKLEEGLIFGGKSL